MLSFIGPFYENIIMVKTQLIKAATWPLFFASFGTTVMSWFMREELCLGMILLIKLCSWPWIMVMFFSGGGSVESAPNFSVYANLFFF